MIDTTRDQPDSSVLLKNCIVELAKLHKNVNDNPHKRISNVMCALDIVTRRMEQTED